MTAMEKAHALVVGISAYQQIRGLGEAVRSDVRAIRDVLVDPVLCGYPAENVTLLVDGAATLAGLRSATIRPSHNRTISRKKSARTRR
jgi:metacaspase-1